MYSTNFFLQMKWGLGACFWLLALLFLLGPEMEEVCDLVYGPAEREIVMRMSSEVWRFQL